MLFYAMMVLPNAVKVLNAMMMEMHALKLLLKHAEKLPKDALLVKYAQMRLALLTAPLKVMTEMHHVMVAIRPLSSSSLLP